MTHHQQSDLDRVHAAQATHFSSGRQPANGKPSGGEEENPADVDEPPENHIRFARIAMPSRHSSMSDSGCPSPHYLKTKNASLLTQALHSGSDLTSSSETEAPALTSDGGLTSLTTPSPPPLSTTESMSFQHQATKDPFISEPDVNSTSSPPSTSRVDSQNAQETSLEAGLKQRRCITFACGRQRAPQQKIKNPEKVSKESEDAKPTEPSKRPYMLRFACPFKASNQADRSETSQKPPLSPVPKDTLTVPLPHPRYHRDSGSTVSTVKEASRERTPSTDARGRTNSATKRQKLGKADTTTFHAFGGSFGTEEEWTREEIKDKEKITVNDTLRKENAIRQLGKEAEEEAIEEDEDEDDEDDEDMDDAGDNDDEDDDDFSDGNETDNEEGFADSDDESDVDSDYQFWTPGLTTAATSTDHIEHIRPTTHRKASDSSIESIIDLRERRVSYENSTRRNSAARSAKKTERLRPGTPDLPDSTDFVCGTLDEDRPLEAAYMSCLEQRKRSKHRIIPQDIDPSFPTSDPEMDEEDDDNEDEMAISRSSSGSNDWIAGRPDDSDSDDLPSRTRCPLRKGGKSPMPSPKRLRSPPPLAKRAVIHKSPTRKLFGHSPPPKVAQSRVGHGLKSPLSTRMTSPSGSPKQTTTNMALPRLAQRPHLTHTASLPRTPNPFWSKHRTYLDALEEASGTSPAGNNLHSRGPIDIVKGLENKRQRRREKYWRQHCRQAGNHKERRCQPGKGAERMKEVGLEMAEKCRGYGNRPKLVLSV
ncbi:MAG: hypothetical protein Q9191_005617 [Dirinaria sp. TL-2023a]